MHLFSFRSFVQTTLTDTPSLNIIDLHSQVNCLPFIYLNPENTAPHLGRASLFRALYRVPLPPPPPDLAPPIQT